MSTPSINDCARSLPEDFDEDFGEDCVEGTDEYQHLTEDGKFPRDLDWTIQTEILTDGRPLDDPIGEDDWENALEYGRIGVDDTLVNGDFYHDRIGGALVAFSFSFYRDPRGDGTDRIVAVGECHPAEEIRGDYHTYTDEVLARAVILIQPRSERTRDAVLEYLDLYNLIAGEGDIPDLDGGDGLWKLGRDSRNAALDWLIHGETGISSRAILETALTGKAPEKALPPLDAGDFRRCILMLERVPAARARLRTLGEKSREWQMLGECWDELARTLWEEWGRELEARGEQNGAPRTREILLEICRGRKEA